MDKVLLRACSRLVRVAADVLVGCGSHAAHVLIMHGAGALRMKLRRSMERRLMSRVRGRVLRVLRVLSVLLHVVRLRQR